MTLQREADRSMAVIPDFIANCGMARTFAYLMSAGAKTVHNRRPLLETELKRW